MLFLERARRFWTGPFPRPCPNHLSHLTVLELPPFIMTGDLLCNGYSAQASAKTGRNLLSICRDAWICTYGHLLALRMMMVEDHQTEMRELISTASSEGSRLINRCLQFLVFMYGKGFPYGSAGKEPVWNARHLGSIPGEGNGYPPQYFGLENSMDCIVHGVAKSWTLLSDDFHTWKRGVKWKTVMSQI